MEDPFLNYLALGLPVFVVIVLVYGIIAIHDIPARIAKKRHHPHEDAIDDAGWWIWATAYKPERDWGFSDKPAEPAAAAEAVTKLDELKRRLTTIEAKLGLEDSNFGEDQPRGSKLRS